MKKIQQSARLYVEALNHAVLALDKMDIQVVEALPEELEGFARLVRLVEGKFSKEEDALLRKDQNLQDRLYTEAELIELFKLRDKYKKAYEEQLQENFRKKAKIEALYRSVYRPYFYTAEAIENQRDGWLSEGRADKERAPLDEVQGQFSNMYKQIREQLRAQRNELERKLDVFEKLETLIPVTAEGKLKIPPHIQTDFMGISQLTAKPIPKAQLSRDRKIVPRNLVEAFKQRDIWSAVRFVMAREGEELTADEKKALQNVQDDPKLSGGEKMAFAKLGEGFFRALGGYYEVQPFLVEYIDEIAINADGKSVGLGESACTLLYLATVNGDSKSVKLLLEKGALYSTDTTTHVEMMEHFRTDPRTPKEVKRVIQGHLADKVAQSHVEQAGLGGVVNDAIKAFKRLIGGEKGVQ